MAEGKEKVGDTPSGSGGGPLDGFFDFLIQGLPGLAIGGMAGMNPLMSLFLGPTIAEGLGLQFGGPTGIDAVEDASSDELLHGADSIISGQGNLAREGLPGLGERANDKSFAVFAGKMEGLLNDPDLTEENRAVLQNIYDGARQQFKSTEGILGSDLAGLFNNATTFAQDLGALEDARAAREGFLGGEQSRLVGERDRFQDAVRDPNKLRTDIDLGGLLTNLDNSVNAAQRTGLRQTATRQAQRGSGFSGKSLANSLAIQQGASDRRRQNLQGVQGTAESLRANRQGQLSGIEREQAGLVGEFGEQRSGILAGNPFDASGLQGNIFGDQIANLGIKDASFANLLNAAQGKENKQTEGSSTLLSILTGGKLS